MVEIEIEAGTTGKPRQGGDQQAWATILPLIEKMLGQIRQAFATNDHATANSLIELVKETMHRMGDESDPDRFIPRIPPPGSPGAGAPPPAVIPKITVQLKGEVDPATAQALAQPAVTMDAIHQAMMPPMPGSGVPGAPAAAPGPVSGSMSPAAAPGAPMPPGPMPPH